MALYLFHYCFELPKPLSPDLSELTNPNPNPKPPVQVHDSIVLTTDTEMEYLSDVNAIERYLTDDLGKAGNIMCNVRVLGWQRLNGEQRPGETV